jgi:predicted ATP-grasp superfamily ATP-dependent carboligase
LASSASRVLVLEGQLRQALAVVRSLGRAGLEVTAGENTLFAPALFSRYTRHRFTYPSHTDHPDLFREAILDRVMKHRYEVLYAMGEPALEAITAQYDLFSRHTRLAFPPPAILGPAMDKRDTILAARQHGIPHPKSFIVGHDGTFEDAVKSVAWPAVIKPGQTSGSRGLAIVNSAEELRARYPGIVAEYGPALIQEYIPLDTEIGVNALLDYDSQMKAVCVHRRLRSYPVSGGPSTLRDTIRHPEAVAMAGEFLKKLNWWGVAMVEFRIDARDGVPKLMEVNPRFWGSLQLSILAGVDFPVLLHKLVTTGRTDRVMDYRVGTKCRWLVPGDLLHFMAAPDKLKLLPEFLKFHQKDMGYDTFAWNDLMPSVALLATVARFSFSRKMWSFVIRNPGKTA